MSLSRLQLAAALLEYDNLDAPPTSRPVSHRDSALFKPFQPRPLDAIPIVHPGHQSVSHTTHHADALTSAQSISAIQGRYLPGSHPDDQPPRPRRRDSTFDPSLIPAHPTENVDLDRWGLPSHLVSPEMAGPADSTSTVPRASDRSLPPLRNSTLGHTPLAVSSPLSDRINSIHLDVMDGMVASGSMDSRTPTESARDAYEEANEAIARAQRLQSMHDDTPRIRTRSNTSNASTGLNTATGVPLPPSPASTLMSFRPTGDARRGSMDLLGDQGMEILDRPGSSMSRNSYDMLYGGQPVRPGTGMSRESMDGRRPSMSGRRGSRSMSLMHGDRRTIHDEPGLREELDERGEEVSSPNPFALPPPPAEVGSRFDPKILEAQRKSIDLTRPLSRLSISSQDRLSRVQPSQFMPVGQPGSTLTEEHLQEYLAGGRRPSHPLEQLDPISGRELHHLDEIPSAAEYGKPLRPNKYGPMRPVDRRSLLRPKTLIMPTPLTNLPPPPSPPKNVPDGYVLGAKPLPAGARSSILTTTDPRAQATIGRPGLPLSLSQKTFRSSLMVGGKREEEEYWVGGATEDGDVGVEWVGDELEGPIDRRPGKLYGKSLMDQLEARKSAMKSKQRAFTGDARPAMMARQAETGEQSTMEQGISRSNTIKTRQPLLKIDSSGEIDLNPLNPNISPIKSLDGAHPGANNDRMTKSRSVFGVDTIWEKEMAKLKVIQEAEDRARARKEAEDALEGKKKEKKKSKDKDKDKGRSKRTSAPLEEQPTNQMVDISPVPVVSDLPPQISYSPEKAPKPQIVDPITDKVKDVEEGVDLDLSGEIQGSLRDDQYDDEKAEWSGDEETPLKTDKGKQRASGHDSRVRPTSRQIAEDLVESDSEEDVPLSRIVKTSSVRAPAEESDSEEDVPLSQLKPTSPPTSIRLPTTSGFGTGSLGLETNVPIGIDPLGASITEGDEDDVPLMLRRSTVRPLSTANGPAMDPDVEDDLPLGFKHADAVVRKNAETWRNTMTSPHHTGSQYGLPQMAMPMPMSMSMGNMAIPQMGHMGHMSMPPMMNGYPYGYPQMPYGGMGYPSPSMNMNMNQAGWNGMPGGQGGMPFVSPMPMGGDMGPMPQAATQNIDSWRQEVAIQPVPTGGGASSIRTSGSTR